MNILFIKHFFVGFMVSEIPRVTPNTVLFLILNIWHGES